MTVTKIKFTNNPSVVASNEVQPPCKDYVEGTYYTHQNVCEIIYKFDYAQNAPQPLMVKVDTWVGEEDLDELIMFLKAAKKRILKVKAKNAAEL